MQFLKRLLLAVTTVTLLSTLAMLAAPKTDLACSGRHADPRR
jgi:hypothetical protein